MGSTLLERIRRTPFLWAASSWVTFIGLASGIAQLLDLAVPPGVALVGLGVSLVVPLFLATLVRAFWPPEAPGAAQDDHGAVDADTDDSGNRRGDMARAEVVRPHIVQLPEILTTFVGRARELDAVGSALAGGRLITIAGVGGSGKTRLAVEVARRRASSSDGDVVFVDLTAVEEDDRVAQVLSASLRLQDTPDVPVLRTLTRALSDRDALLVLDNCEHVLRGVRVVVETILAACADVRFLATSREALGLDGEVTWLLEPLPVPAVYDSVETAVLSDAIRLFVSRAKESASNFELTDQNVDEVVELCRRLDGLPLAMEIAAARLRFMGPSTLVEQLTNQLSWKARRSSRAPSHQQTLRDTMEWSYQLLSADDQVLLRRLGAFAGAFDARAVVACAPEWPQEKALEVLGHLVDSSLVMVRSGSSGRTRYRLLATVQSYARELLEATIEHEVVVKRHVAFYLERVEELGAELTGHRRVAMLAELDRDYDDIRAAMRWVSTSSHDSVATMRFSGSLFWYWNFRGFLTEAQEWYAAATAMGDERRTEWRARCLYGAGGTAFLLGRLGSARDHLEESCEIWQELDLPRGEGFTRIVYGMVELYRGETDAASEHERRAVEIFRQLNDQWGLALALNDMGNVMAAAGNIEAAKSRYQLSLTLWTGLDDTWGKSLTLNNIAVTACHEDDHERATEAFEQALQLQRQNADRWGQAWSTMGLADVAYARDDLDPAEDLYRRSLVLHLDIGRLQLACDCLVGLASVSRRRHEFSAAAILLGAAQGLRNRLGVRSGIPQRDRLERELGEFQLTLNERHLTELFESGLGLTPDQAVRAAREPTWEVQT